MENTRIDVRPHPQLLEMLFAFKNKVSNVFKDVLGLYEIHHISLTHINKQNELLTLSSTPSMEYNLFSSQLWRYDQSYDPKWYHLGAQDYWQNLYNQSRYDELYYLKQIKHAFPIGLSLAATLNENHVVYSLASHKSCAATKEIFLNQQEDFYKIGQYCSNRLNPLFDYCDSTDLPTIHLKAGCL
jgi:hypothetical protein